MVRLSSYSSLLPMYLAGDNIRRHGEIMDAEDKHVDDMLYVLEHLFELERPILVENNPSSSTSSTVTIHIHCPDPIRSIVCTGDYSCNLEYERSDLLLDTVLSFEYSCANAPCMPSLNISVESYKDVVYTRRYPENDEILDDDADHDIYLDVVGALIGLPRRSLKSYNLEDEGSIAMPPYFAKSVSFSGGEYFADVTTEDDYYYSMRLREYVSHLYEYISPINLLKARYGYQSLALSNVDGMDASLVKQYFTMFSDMTVAEVEEYITGCESAIYIIFYDNSELPVNVHGLETQEEEEKYLQLYFPCTRLAAMHEMGESSVTQSIISAVAGEVSVLYTVYLSEGAVLPNFPLTVTVDGVESEVVTDSRGRFYLSLDAGSHTVTVLDETTSTGALVDETLTVFIPSFTSSSRALYYLNEDEHVIMESVLSSDNDGGAFATTEVTYTITEDG